MRDTKTKRQTIIVLLLVLTAVFTLSACATSPTTPNQASPSETVTAFIGDLSASTTASGQLVAGRQVTLSAAVPARAERVAVRVGDQVAAGDLLIQLDTADLELNLAIAEQTLRLQEANLANLLAPAPAADIAAAAATVTSAQAQLDALLAGPTEAELALAETNLRAAQASLLSASSELNRANDTITEAQIQAAEANLAAAQLQLNNARRANEDNPTETTHQARLEAEQAFASAQAQLNELRRGPDNSAAQSNLAAAAARRDSAQAEYDLQTGGPTATQIASARSQLAQAEAALAALVEPATAAQLTAAEAEVAQAELSLVEAQTALADATLHAPFAGVITAVYVNEGEIASGPVIELLDLDSLRLRLRVDEQDVAALSLGQPVVLTLDAWPNDEVEAELSHIAPGARQDPGTGLVTYDVDVRLGETTLPIRAGMSANANLITAEKENVLLVPNQAISADRASGTFSVNLVTDDGVQTVPVTIGLRDGRYTEITGGLQAGDQLRLDTSAPRATFGPPN